MTVRATARFLFRVAAAAVSLAAWATYLVSPADASTASRLPNITSFDISILGLAATVDPLEPTVPKNVESGVRIVVKSGARVLTAEEVAAQVGGPFEVRAELSGPGLDRAITLPQRGPSDPPLADPLLLPIPALSTSGDYSLANIRIIRSGRPVLDVSPSSVTVKVIDQILVTSVTTRPLTLDEIREKGIVLDSDDYLGFEFTIGLASNSQSVAFTMPVVFDREGVPVPQVLTPPPAPPRVGVTLEGDPPQPLILPTLLELKPDELDAIPDLELRLPSGQPVQIPSVLVIPGNVGYLKQFFSAQLFVANGAPPGTTLLVKDVTGTLKLPKGADDELGTADDPLALPETVRGPQPATMPVRGVGLDGEPGTADDVAVLRPAQQGQAEFLIRGEKEGFHSLEFDIDATLEGLAVGDVGIRGKARGGVLVRNPFFDMTFTIPSVVRKGEPFSMFATVTNIGQGIANDVHVTLDASRMGGASLVGEPTQIVDTLRSGDAKTLEFKFVSTQTGQVNATYLNFDTQGPGGGSLKFTLGVGERNIALSPDTLVLPAAVDSLPPGVVAAAMRVLGQAWSISNAPTGTLPAGVIRVSREIATEKALALAEAGLRVSFGQGPADAVRDLATDFYGGERLDPGFDQLLRETNAGHDLARAVGFELRPALESAGSTLAYGTAVDRVAVSGLDFIRFGIGSGTGAAPVAVSVTDAGGRKSAAPAAPGQIPASAIPGAVWLPLGSSASEPLVGLVTAVSSPLYTLELVGTGSGSVDLSVTAPRGGGQFVRGVVTSLPVAQGSRARLVIDLRQPDTLMVEVDAEGDTLYESSLFLSTTVVQTSGPELISATVVGPETIDGASPFGFHVALLFDRVADAVSAGTPASYSIPKNAVLSARSQLSGRFVFASLAQPEGPYVPTSFATSGVRDQRGARGPPRSVSLGSRLADAGAVVSGRVIGPDGAPLTTGSVTYQNNSNWQCLGSIFEANPEAARSGFATVPLDATGRYEFRYVRQDDCGFPWAMLTTDPRSGALRSVSGFVRAAGERIELDIALLGQGSVSGVVRDLTAEAVPGAAVTVVSQTDPQVGGTAVTDGDGRYEVFGITVGGVSVSAAKGSGAGYASGSIPRAGGSAVVNVTLDSGGAAVGGTVVIEEGSETREAAGVTMVFEASGVPVAVTTTDRDGDYAFESVPVGPFKVKAHLNSRDNAEVAGIVAAGQTLEGIDLVIRMPDPNGGGGGGTGPGFGTVRGFVLFANGEPAPEAIVSIDGRGVLSEADGAFQIPGVEVRPGQARGVQARSRDGLRSGSATAFVNQAGQIVEGVIVVLSGLGSAEFTVLSASGTPVVGQAVGLLDRCTANCGCQPQISDANGKVRFDDLPIGAVHVHAVRPGTSFVDVAGATTSITEDGEVAVGVLRFPGAGSVSGTVRNGQGQPVFGAEIALQSLMYSAEHCGLVGGVSQRIRSDTLGRFRFQAVNLGFVSVTASQTFFPTPTTRTGVLAANTQELTLDLVLNEGVSTIAGELSGTVYLPNGTTPAGAGIEVTATGAIPDVVVTTNAAGRYRFAKIFPEGAYTLTFRDPITGAVAQSGVQLRAGDDMAHDVRLLGRGTVVVRVVDANGAPVNRAFVRVRESSFPRREFEGAADAANQGVVTFDNVFEGPVSAEVSDPIGRGGRAAGVLVAPGARLELEVALSITGRVSGIFVGADGTTPVPFGAITLTQHGRVLGQTTAQGSGAELGRFSFDNVPAGPFRVDAQDPATARTGFSTGTIVTQDQVANVTIRAQGVGTVEGFVTKNGAPQPGADVELIAGARRANTMSDSEGRYRITGVPEGPVSVTASLGNAFGNGFLKGSVSSNLVGDGATLTLDVPLADSGDAGGVVVRAGGGPASQSLVTIRVGGAGGGSFSTLTDAQGRFFFGTLPAGSASISVDVLGSIDQGSASVVVPAGGTANVTVTLNGVGSIRGIARASNGEPTAGTVTISGTGALPYSRTLAVGSNGTFQIAEVLAGPFVASLTVQTATFALYGTASGSVTPDHETFVEVQVQPSGVVRGRALRSNGATAALGTEITLRLLPNRGTLTFNAGGDGRFETTGVPLGNFELRLLDRVAGGVGLVEGRSIGANGQLVDVGDVILDDTPVEAVAFEPSDGSLNVPVNQPIVVLFSDRLASPAGITVSNGTSSLPANPTLSSNGLSVTLNGTWTDSSDIFVTVTTQVTDIFGRRPREARTAKFHTVDLSPPRVVAVVPFNQAVEVSATTAVDVTFHEELGAATDFSTLIIVSGPTGSIPGFTERMGPASARFTPASPLAENATFTVSVNGAVDVVGNKQTIAFTSSFKTHDTVPPVLALVQPVPGTWTSNNKPPIVVSLTDALSGVNAESGALAIDGVPVLPVRSTSALNYTPPTPLSDGVHALTASVADRGGNVGTLDAELRVDSQPPGPAEIAGVSNGNVLVGSVPISASAADSGSGVREIRIASDGVTVLTLVEPSFAATLSSTSLSEGAHVLSARAVDRAGNVGPSGPAVSVLVNNQPILVTIMAPPPGTRVQQSVAVSATASEPIARMVFSTDESSTADDIVDDVPPYAATVDLSGGTDRTVVLTARAEGFVGDVGSATREIEVDRKAPTAPNVALIFAEPPDNGISFVHGDAGAVENGARVIATNTRTADSANVLSKLDGSFGLGLAGVVGDTVSLVAQDSAGNTSPPSTVVIRAVTTLPPVAATLRFEGVLVDRVGAGTPALSSDGKRDAVFTASFSLGAGITRQLSFVELEGPKNLSTRPEVGATLGVVKSELGAPFLNGADGQVEAPLTENVSLLLFAPVQGLLQVGATYRVTAAFTDGHRFIGTFLLGALPTEEAVSVTFSARNAALPFDPSGPPGALVATEVVSGAFSVSNRALPFDPVGPPGALLASETVSNAFSVANLSLPFSPTGPPGALLASETVSTTFSVLNRALPFDLGGPPGALLASETVGTTFSVLNQALPFAVSGPALLASEAASNVISIHNDPNAPQALAAHDDSADRLAPGELLPGGVQDGGAPHGGAQAVDGGIGSATLPVLSVSDVTVTESAGEARFELVLSPPTATDVSVSYELVRETATPESEYAPLTGTLTLSAGTTKQTLAVPLYDDTLDERSETFVLALADPVGATLETEEAVATVTDDDGAGEGRSALFEELEVEAFDDSRWNETLSGEIAFAEGIASLGGSAIETAQRFDSDFVTARARLRLREGGQRFGWNPFGTLESSSYYFESAPDTAAGGRAVARGFDVDRKPVTLLDVEVIVGANEFADFAIERRAGSIGFFVDGVEVARADDLTADELPIGLWGEDAKAPLDVDWIDVRSVLPDSNACIPPHAGLEAWWPGDGHTNDLAGGLNGVLEGGAGFAPGKVGQAFAFDGFDAMLWIPESHELAPRELTLAAWVEVRAFPRAGGLSTLLARPAKAVSSANVGEAAYAIQLDAEGRSFFALWDGERAVRITAPGGLSTGTWHHIAASRRGPLMILYVDGAEVASGTLDGEIAYERALGFDIEVGNYPSLGPGRAFDGSMDEVSIYGRALDATEILEIYEASGAGYCLP
jgi:hypothetical protein